MDRIREYDGLRGVAITMVVVVHVAEMTGASSYATPLWRLVAAGGVAVPVFFVLSGFLLYRPWLRGPVAVGRYYRRRALRILPSHWAVLAVTLPVFSPAATDDAVAWLELGTLTHLLDPSPWWPGAGWWATGPAALGPLWSLSVEASFYLLLPALSRLPPRGIAALAAACALATVLVRTCADFPALFFYQHLLPAYFPCFAAGMLLAGWAERGLRPPPGLCWAVGACALGLVSTTLARTLPGIPQNAAQYLTEMTLQLVVGIAWVAGTLGGSALLRAAPLVWLGTLSYGIYLWHMPVIEGWYLVTGRPVWGHDFGAVMLVTTVVVVPLAAATYALLELPTHRGVVPMKV